MRGRYNGTRMSVSGSIIPGASRLAGLGKELSKTARQRLKWFDYYHSHGRNAALTCRYFGISRQTFYRWKRRYSPHDLLTLEERSHRPKRVRQPTWSGELVEGVLRLREEHPRWGKEKIARLLPKGLATSVSTVGRLLQHLKERGVLKEPIKFPVSAGKRHKGRPYAIRKPREYQVKAPGDLIEVDTLDIRPLPGVVLKQFTARDVVSRWDVLEVHTRATASTAAHFLETLKERMPFSIKAIQVDGGSEFMAQFEEACQREEIRLFELPPRSPKLNGHVERANRTHTEEFWECYDGDFEIGTVGEALLAQEVLYNTVRPHQALGYLTPKQFLEQSGTRKRKEDVSLIL